MNSNSGANLSVLALRHYPGDFLQYPHFLNLIYLFALI